MRPHTTLPPSHPATPRSVGTFPAPRRRYRDMKVHVLARFAGQPPARWGRHLSAARRGGGALCYHYHRSAATAATNPSTYERNGNNAPNAAERSSRVLAAACAVAARGAALVHCLVGCGRQPLHAPQVTIRQRRSGTHGIIDLLRGIELWLPSRTDLTYRVTLRGKLRLQIRQR